MVWQAAAQHSQKWKRGILENAVLLIVWTNSSPEIAIRKNSLRHRRQNGGIIEGKSDLGVVSQETEKPLNRCGLRAYEVEDNGLEPMTFWLPARRSPN
jgi:hypothetical protein